MSPAYACCLRPSLLRKVSRFGWKLAPPLSHRSGCISDFGQGRVFHLHHDLFESEMRESDPLKVGRGEDYTPTQFRPPRRCRSRWFRDPERFHLEPGRNDCAGKRGRVPRDARAVFCIRFRALHTDGCLCVLEMLASELLMPHVGAIRTRTVFEQ